MLKTESLLKRLDEIGQSLSKKEGARILLGLGSVGSELERLDEFSDLDFFVVVQTGYGQRFIDQLDWLADAYPLAYAFKNSDVGCKILFEDGIYGEYAIFEEQEFPNIPYVGGRVVWRAPNFEMVIEEQQRTDTLPSIRRDSLDYPLNEALTNLYVGLERFARGEKLSAIRFVESYAINSILSVLHLVEPETNYYPDSYGNERRLEKRFPMFAERIGSMMLGYDHVPQSVLQILQYLESIYPVNPRMAAEIRHKANQLLLL